ncbi:DUF4136 domain-containing protein [Oxalobacteraceae bacterium CAVE-383]|nr:DUF4136 domain-containing protein [Oxalobacteraceae bacterium CAVE-383]
MIQRLRLAAALLLLGAMVTGLTGCAATIQSDVIAFHQWPADMKERTFAFQRSAGQDASLEYRVYEDLVRNELLRLGYIADTEKRGAALTVAIGYDVRTAQVVVNQPYDPFWYGPGFYPGWGWRHGAYPYYDPFFGPPMQQTTYPIYTRRLHIVINATADKKPLYEVEVSSEGQNANLSKAMPYMVRSAFSDFPGQSGVMHRVKLKID